MHSSQFVSTLLAIAGLVVAVPVAKPGTVTTEDAQLYTDTRFIVANDKAKREKEPAPQLYTQASLLVNEKRREQLPQLYKETTSLFVKEKE